jgi:hypothetical protein
MPNVGIQVNCFRHELVELMGNVTAGLILRKYAPTEDLEDYEY